MLAASGMIGSSAMGRGADKILLNAANGNLIVDRGDEVLIGRGPDSEVSHTYNSLNDPSFAWTLGAYRVLYGLTGTANTAGSTIRRIDRDVHVRVYSYDANADLSRITNANGDYTQFTNINGKPTEVTSYYSFTKGTKTVRHGLRRLSGRKQHLQHLPGGQPHRRLYQHQVGSGSGGGRLGRRHRGSLGRR